MTSNAWTIVSIFAGSIGAIAGAPKAFQRVRKFRHSTFDLADFFRDSVVLASNLLWVAYGIASKQPAIEIFCSIQVAIMTSLLGLNLASLMRGNPISK
jgi:hypothetical protein